MEIGIQAVFGCLTEAGQADRVTPVIVERRGRREDAELELSFRRICDASEAHARPISLELVMVPKTRRSVGLSPLVEGKEARFIDSIERENGEKSATRQIP